MAQPCFTQDINFHRFEGLCESPEQHMPHVCADTLAAASLFWSRTASFCAAASFFACTSISAISSGVVLSVMSPFLRSFAIWTPSEILACTRPLSSIPEIQHSEVMFVNNLTNRLLSFAATVTGFCYSVQDTHYTTLSLLYYHASQWHTPVSSYIFREKSQLEQLSKRSSPVCRVPALRADVLLSAMLSSQAGSSPPLSSAGSSQLSLQITSQTLNSLLTLHGNKLNYRVARKSTGGQPLTSTCSLPSVCSMRMHWMACAAPICSRLA